MQHISFFFLEKSYRFLINLLLNKNLFHIKKSAEFQYIILKILILELKEILILIISK